MNPCLAPLCDEQIPANIAACRPHWFELPRPVRDEVWAGWTEQPKGKRHRDALLACVRWWRTDMGLGGGT